MHRWSRSGSCKTQAVDPSTHAHHRTQASKLTVKGIDYKTTLPLLLRLGLQKGRRNLPEPLAVRYTSTTKQQLLLLTFSRGVLTRSIIRLQKGRIFDARGRQASHHAAATINAVTSASSITTSKWGLDSRASSHRSNYVRIHLGA